MSISKKIYNKIRKIQIVIKTESPNITLRPVRIISWSSDRKTRRTIVLSKKSEDHNSNEKRKRRKKKQGPLIGLNVKVRPLQPKTLNQSEYLRSIEKFPVTFCIGPAGTGKTFLACAVAAQKLVEGNLKKITLVRPAVEAGEKLGFLPGDINDKLHPYLIPLFDSLSDMVGLHHTRTLLKDGIIEVVPLGFMRGRTMNNSFVILDEAQNATKAQMKMFLTRMGQGTTFVINGDVTQTDLDKEESGLADACRRLGNKSLKHVNWVELTRDDIVRHPAVQEIVDAYGEEHNRAF